MTRWKRWDMHRDERGGAGPFAYYPASGDAIRDTATEVGNRAADIGAVRRQVEADHRRALAGVDGDLTNPMAGAADALVANADRVEQAAWFAAGVVRLFADAVDDYNLYSIGPRSVEALNLAYTESLIDDFGMDAAAYAKGGARAGRDYDADRADAEADLLRSLTAEHHRLGEQLDVWASHAARMLDRGPNAEDISELWAFGSLGSDAYEVWPGLQLVDVPMLRLPYDLRDGSDDYRSLDDLDQDELLDLAEDGFEPARDLLADQVVDEFENHTALQNAWRSINPTYLDAVTSGVPEDLAQLLAEIYPTTYLDVFLGGPAMASKVLYSLTAKDLVDAIRDDPFSLRALAEVAMVLPVGRVGSSRTSRIFSMRSMTCATPPVR